ncbi:hypothetical protein ES703_74898 [subsurface metagenome]
MNPTYLIMNAKKHQFTQFLLFTGNIKLYSGVSYPITQGALIGQVDQVDDGVLYLR